MQPQIAILVLAAGSSSRMGIPKQLLPWKNRTLIESVICTAQELGCANNIVILGAHYHKIKPTIENYSIKTIYNKNWKKGLGNSIAFGVQHIKNNYQVDGILVILADQPLVDSSYLMSLIDTFEVGKNNIIVSNYGNKKVGVPALFDKSYFDELSTLDEDKGAKQILKKHIECLNMLKAEHLIADIDTKEDYEQLYKANHQL